MMFKRYITLVLGGVGLLSMSYVLLYNALEWNGLKIQAIPTQTLYVYQYAKAQHSDAELIFVGDSALGNAINANLFSELSGIPTENYAMTGSFGFRGSLDMIKEVHSHNPDLKSVIIMQTLDMFTRPVAQEYKPAKRVFVLSDFTGLNIGIFNFVSLEQLWKALINKTVQAEQKPIEIENDYIRQTNPRPRKETLKPISESRVNRDKAQFLLEIAQYCRDSNLGCYYLHAPVAEGICQSDAYLKTVNIIIEKTGIELLAPEPLCIPYDQLGDSSDHVAPEYKNAFTRKYSQFFTDKFPAFEAQ